MEHRGSLDFSLFDNRFRSEAYRDIDIRVDKETCRTGDVPVVTRSLGVPAIIDRMLSWW